MNCSPTNLVGIETKGAIHTSSPGSPVFNILDDYDSYKDYENDYDSYKDYDNDYDSYKDYDNDNDS